MSRFPNSQELHAQEGTRKMQLERIEMESQFKSYMNEAFDAPQETFTEDDMYDAFARGWFSGQHRPTTDPSATIAVPRATLEQWDQWLSVRNEGVVNPPLLTDGIQNQLRALLDASTR